MCGENDHLTPCRLTRLGSPPRVRGKLNELRKYVAAMRITPACAGKTHCCRNVVSLFLDHPRVCGENWVLTPSVALLPGSPPRVRGKLVTVSYSTNAVRITPACAGKTISICKKQVVE